MKHWQTNESPKDSVHTNMFWLTVRLLTAASRPFCAAARPKTLPFAQAGADEITSHLSLTEIITSPQNYKTTCYCMNAGFREDIREEENTYCETHESQTPGIQAFPKHFQLFIRNYYNGVICNDKCWNNLCIFRPHYTVYLNCSIKIILFYYLNCSDSNRRVKYIH